jgi:hypothetical protein
MADLPAWIRQLPQRGAGDDLPAWLRDALRAQGAGGHRATAAERRAAYARFAAARNAAARSRPARGAVFASMRAPDDMSPLARKLFGGR